MKVKTIFYAIVSFLFIIACKNEVDKNPVLNKTQITEEIEDMFHNYYEAVKTDGLQAEFKYLDNSENFFWVPPGYSSTLSYDSVKQILIKNDKIINSIEFSFDVLQVFPLSDSIANYSGIVSGKMIDTTNLETNFKIIESGTLIKRKDGWKLLNGQSRNLP